MGKYRALRLLSSGPTGEVLLGELAGPHGFTRRVAIKRLSPALALDAAAVELFVDQARMGSSFSHENLVHVFDFGRDGDSLYLAAEYVDGGSLRELLRGPAGTPPAVVAAHIVARVCAALQYIHSRCDRAGRSFGIVHRNVGPGKVLVGEHGQIKLLDFGITRARRRKHRTRAGPADGDPACMSPEQSMGQQLDARSDVFSAGTLLYELLCGVAPFAGRSTHETLALVGRAAPRPLHERAPSVPPELVSICQRAHAPHPAERFQTAHEMHELLAAFCGRCGYRNQLLGEWISSAIAFGATVPDRQAPLTLPEDSFPELEHLIVERLKRPPTPTPAPSPRRRPPATGPGATAASSRRAPPPTGPGETLLPASRPRRWREHLTPATVSVTIAVSGILALLAALITRC